MLQKYMYKILSCNLFAFKAGICNKLNANSCCIKSIQFLETKSYDLLNSKNKQKDIFYIKKFDKIIKIYRNKGKIFIRSTENQLKL